MIREPRPGRRPRATRSWLCLASLVLGACAPETPPAAPAASAVAERSPILLRTSFTEVRSPAPGQVLTYGVAMAAGDIFHLRIEQRGLDVAIHWPREPETIDLPYGKYVAEELWWHATVQTELRFDVEVLGGRGDFRLVVEKLGPADDVDVLRAETFWQDRRPGSRPDPGQALGEGLAETARAWRAAKAPAQEALAWAEIAKARKRRGELSTAAEAFDAAVECLNRSPERVLEARMRLERGILHPQRGNFERAVADLLAATRATQQAGDVYGLAVAISHLAVARDVRGDLAKACEGYRRAHRLFARIDVKEAAKAQLQLGRCYLKLGSLPEGPAALRGALRSLERLPGATKLRAEILREIGWWHRLEGRPRDALRVLKQALATRVQTPGILDRLGTVHTDLGELDLARDEYQQALRQAKSSLSTAHVRLNLCRLEEQAGRIDAGLEHCHEALEVFANLGATGSAAQALLLSARLTRQRDLRAAEALAEQALTSIELQRPRMGALERRSAFLAERLDAHQLVIDLRMELDALEPGAGWDARALQVSELTRTRSFLDLLKGRDVVPSSRVDPDFERAEQELRTRIEDMSRRLASESATGQQTSTIAELMVLEEELVAVREQRAAEPAPGATTRMCTLDVAAARRLLDAETLLLVYHLGDRQSYLWRIHRDGVDGGSLGNRERLESLSESWYQLLSDLETTPWTGDLERRRARLLSDILLAPIARELSRYRRLVIVADGVLLRIPFGALPSPGDAAGERPLIADHEVVSLPSVGVLATLRQQLAGRPTAGGLLAVVADPVYDPVAETPAQPPAAPALPAYPRLRGSAEEARALLAMAPEASTLLLERFEACVDRVMAGALEGFRVVHFATHAETQDASGRPLGLVLSRFDVHGAPIEGMLGLRQLYTLRLPAELVVLSACGTALGEEIRGEGLIGLTRGFMHAGTPRVIVSLWEVQDRAARELMALFYRFLLRDQLAPADALRRAQVEMWQARQPPAAWAAFVLQGDWRPFPVTP